MTHPPLFLNEAIVGDDAYLWVNILVSARESDVSPEHDEEGVSLLQCITLVIQVQASLTQRQLEQSASPSVGGWSPERRIFLINELQ